MTEAFTDLEQPKWMWCHEGTTLHILWYPDEEETRDKLRREFGREDLNWLSENNKADLRRAINAVGPYALCGTQHWEIGDGDKPPVGREDLICGACMDALDERYGTQERQVAPVSATERYKAYLESEHWQHMRLLAREHYGDRCVLCGATDGLDVHHRTYERRGHERLSDLIVLCRDCHTRYHEHPA